MTTHYRVLRPVSQDDLDASHESIAKVLRLIPREGYVTFDMFKHLGSGVARRGLARACSMGMLKRVLPHEKVMKLESVRFWTTQLNDSGFKHLKAKSSTKNLYLNGISRLNEWLPGRKFPSYKTVLRDGQIARDGITKSFANVEGLMRYCMESDHGTRTIQRVIREFLADPQVMRLSSSSYTAVKAAIRSYFDAHDIVLDMRKTKKKRVETGSPGYKAIMTLEDFYKMIQNGRPSIAMRTIMIIKLQSAMDSATLADRFNYEGYEQIVKYFKTDDHRMWNLDECPVPIRVGRVKTDYSHTTFIDRDALSQLREYLTWKEAKHGKHDASKPLFVTKMGNPIYSEYVSRGFSAVAVRAGIQEKISHRVYKIRAHEVRDLLKSTLLTSGCKQYAADHVLGHAPRDSYEKQALLYPDELRKEYSKASARINIFSKVEGNLNSPDDPESQNARIRELEAKVRTLTQSRAEDGLMEGKHKNAMNEMNGKIKRLMRMFDSLPDDVKEKMSDDLEDPEDTDGSQDMD